MEVNQGVWEWGARPPEDLGHDMMTASSRAEGAEAILGRGVGESGG